MSHMSRCHNCAEVLAHEGNWFRKLNMKLKSRMLHALLWTSGFFFFISVIVLFVALNPPECPEGTSPGNVFKKQARSSG